MSKILRSASRLKQHIMSKRKSRDDAELSREFPNHFTDYAVGQLLRADGKVCNNIVKMFNCIVDTVED